MKLFQRPRKRIFCLGAFVCSVVLFSASNYLSQTPAKSNSASISGRVTVAEKGVADVTVVAISATAFDGRTIGRAKTDQEGNYRIDGLPAGSFRLSPVTLPYALEGSHGVPEMRGQTINVVDGEAVDRVDFKLVRGGVITGRITDVDGNPVIGEQVGVHGSNVRSESWSFENPRNRTDDRGIYRIFGLAAGEYRVSVGQDNPSAIGSAIGRSGGFYIKTYFPGTTKQSEAKVLELKEGAELSNVDFVVGRLSDGFAISGRVVDNTGKPQPTVSVGYSRVVEGKQDFGGLNFMSLTDADGKFRAEGIQPGKYRVFTLGGPTQPRTLYSEVSQFEVVDADVTGIVITLRPGATISGVAVIENNPDPGLIAGLQTIQLYAASSQNDRAPSVAITQINADGTFTLSGLSPGKVRIGIQHYPTPPKGFHLLRVELEGVAKEEIEVTAGADIQGVRLVFNHGAGSLRGRVKTEGGNLPEGARFYVTLVQPGQAIQAFPQHIEVDARGQFFADNISPGTYELKARVRLASGDSPRVPTATRSVTIAHDVETDVTIVLNLTPETGRP
ncbi:MAG TPA: carboxypeptidase-like regulatory domain-containing protein [Pyrinomonadaceae bacterium]|nr:carboxypeptidase-like regulatory domain-containing protein [Pyrinomonadaceae bacterium]